MKLNGKQKKFLFENGYVTAKVLDSSADYENWQNYFINEFTWNLTLELNEYRFRTLHLFDKDNDIDYVINLNFQKNDLQTLLKM